MLQARGADLPEAQGEMVGDVDTDAMLKELSTRGVSVPADGKGAPQYVPPGMGGSAPSGQLFGGPGGKCTFCGRSQNASSAVAVRPKTPGEIARQGGDWRAAMQPKQREARQAYRELMKAKNRAPKGKRVLAIKAPPPPPADAGAAPDLPTETMEPPPQPAPPLEAPAPVKAKPEKTEQQKEAQRAYKERMKAKGHMPAKSRGKAKAKAPAEAAPPKPEEQAWSPHRQRASQP